jgi:mandelamide amidase
MVSPVVGSVLGGCAAGTPTPVPASEQLALTASQAVEAIRTGRLSAEAYMTTLIARAEQFADLNSLIALNRIGALAAARKVDSLRIGGATLPSLAGLPMETLLGSAPIPDL